MGAGLFLGYGCRQSHKRHVTIACIPNPSIHTQAFIGINVFEQLLKFETPAIDPTLDRSHWQSCNFDHLFIGQLLYITKNDQLSENVWNLFKGFLDIPILNQGLNMVIR